MDQRQNRVVNLEPVTSSFLVEDILRRSGSSSFESPMESPSDRAKIENNTELRPAIGYQALSGSGSSQEFTGLSCMVAEAEIKGARGFAQGKSIAQAHQIFASIIGDYIISFITQGP